MIDSFVSVVYLVGDSAQVVVVSCIDFEWLPDICSNEVQSAYVCTGRREKLGSRSSDATRRPHDDDVLLCKVHGLLEAMCEIA